MFWPRAALIPGSSVKHAPFCFHANDCQTLHTCFGTVASQGQRVPHPKAASSVAEYQSLALGPVAQIVFHPSAESQRSWQQSRATRVHRMTPPRSLLLVALQVAGSKPPHNSGKKPIRDKLAHLRKPQGDGGQKGVGRKVGLLVWRAVWCQRSDASLFDKGIAVVASTKLLRRTLPQAPYRQHRDCCVNFAVQCNTCCLASLAVLVLHCPRTKRTQ